MFKNINVTNRKCVYIGPLVVFRFDCVPHELSGGHIDTLQTVPVKIHPS